MAFLLRWPSPQSRYSVRADLAAYYRHCTRLGATPDPTAGVEPPRVPRTDATPISCDDVARLIAGTSGAVRAWCALAAYAGLRVSEIAALRPCDIDDNARTLTVRAGKGGRDRRVPIIDPLASELSGLQWAVSGQTVGAAIRGELRRLGIDGRPHDLRHSFATQAARALGGDLVALAGILGHASVTTTQRYVRFWPTSPERLSTMYDGS